MSQAEAEAAVREEELAAYALKERVQRNQLIQDTAAMPGWALICDVIKEKIAAAQHRLAFGLCKDYEEYRATAAEAEALIWAMAVPELVQQQLSELRRQEAEDRVEADDA